MLTCMRTLINYIRSCFCKHDWELLANSLVYEGDYDKRAVERVWIYRCKKCGCRNKITTD